MKMSVKDKEGEKREEKVRRTIFLLNDDDINGTAKGCRIDRVPGL